MPIAWGTKTDQAKIFVSGRLSQRYRLQASNDCCQMHLPTMIWGMQSVLDERFQQRRNSTFSEKFPDERAKNCYAKTPLKKTLISVIFVDPNLRSRLTCLECLRPLYILQLYLSIYHKHCQLAVKCSRITVNPRGWFLVKSCIIMICQYQSMLRAETRTTLLVRQRAQEQIGASERANIAAVWAAVSAQEDGFRENTMLSAVCRTKN